MANFDKGEDEEHKRGSIDSSNSRLRAKINAKTSVAGITASSRFGRSGSGGVGAGKDEFNNINRYVIDDEEEEDSSVQRPSDSCQQVVNMSSNTSGQSTPREVIFSIEDDDE